MNQNMDTLYIETSEAIAAAEFMKTTAQNILSKLEEIGIEMEKVDNEDEQLYFNTDGKKPAALKEELDQNKATFDKFKEQVDAFADFVIVQANSSQEN